LIVTIGLKSGNVHPSGHLNSLKNLSSSMIDLPQITFIPFPSGMPQLSIDPRDSGHEAIGFDCAKDRACFGIDLVNLPCPILPNPESAFSPRKSRVTAVAGRRDSGENLTRLWINLLNAILGDLKQMPAVEGRSCMRSNIHRALQFAARRIEGIQPVSRCKPDMLAVIANSVHAVSSWEGAILPHDFCV
jgi:hypothetical protein